MHKAARLPEAQARHDGGHAALHDLKLLLYCLYAFGLRPLLDGTPLTEIEYDRGEDKQDDEPHDPELHLLHRHA